MEHEDHSHYEHHESYESHPKQENMTEKLRTNPWIISTFVLEKKTKSMTKFFIFT